MNHLHKIFFCDASSYIFLAGGETPSDAQETKAPKPTVMGNPEAQNAKLLQSFQKLQETNPNVLQMINLPTVLQAFEKKGMDAKAVLGQQMAKADSALRPFEKSGTGVEKGGELPEATSDYLKSVGAIFELTNNPNLSEQQRQDAFAERYENSLVVMKEMGQMFKDISLSLGVSIGSFLNPAGMQAYFQQVQDIANQAGPKIKPEQTAKFEQLRTELSQSGGNGAAAPADIAGEIADRTDAMNSF